MPDSLLRFLPYVDPATDKLTLCGEVLDTQFGIVKNIPVVVKSIKVEDMQYLKVIFKYHHPGNTIGKFSTVHLDNFAWHTYYRHVLLRSTSVLN